MLGNKLHYRAELNRQGPPETELTLYRCSGSVTGVFSRGLDGRRDGIGWEELAGSAGEGFDSKGFDRQSVRYRTVLLSRDIHSRVVR